jgi:hypothetical protein
VKVVKKPLVIVQSRCDVWNKKKFIFSKGANHVWR